MGIDMNQDFRGFKIGPQKTALVLPNYRVFLF